MYKLYIQFSTVDTVAAAAALPCYVYVLSEANIYSTKLDKESLYINFQQHWLLAF